MTKKRQGRARMAFGLALPAAFLLLLIGTATASAARDPIAKGTTDLHMKKGFMRKLNNNGINVSGVGVGTVTGNKIALVVDGGKLDPTNTQGFLETEGGFKLSLGKRGVPVTQLTVNTVKNAVYARIAKARMQLGELVTPLKADREGFGSHFLTPQMKLTAKAVKRISNRLGLKGSHRLNGGRTLSNAYATAQPSTVTVLPQGSATLAGNTGTLAKFGAKGVKLPAGISAIAPASKPTPTSFLFPITGGTLAPDASNGTVTTAGSVQILKEAEPFSPTMRLKDIAVDFQAKTATVELEILPTPPFPGATGRASIADIVLPPGSVVANEATRQITISGAEARLQAVAASTLNNVFNQPAPEPPPSSNFVVGDVLGTFSMTVQAQ